MSIVDDINNAIDRLDKQRKDLKKAKYLANELVQYQCDNDNLDDFLFEKFEEDIFFEIENRIGKALMRLSTPLMVYYTLKFMENLDDDSNEITDPPIRSLLTSSILKTVKHTKQHEDQLKTCDYAGFFKQLAYEVCVTKKSAKRSRND